MSVYQITYITFVFNVFCGIFRVRQTKLKWKLLYIHLPIPFIAYMRITSGISWQYIPLLVAVAIIGQLGGGKINSTLFPDTMPNANAKSEKED